MRSPAAIPFDRLRGPPRPVSFALRVRLCLSGLGTIACIVLAFTSFLAGMFGVPQVLHDLALPDGPLVTVEGHVTRVAAGNMEINHQAVYRIDHTVVVDGATHQAVSFQTGAPRLKEADRVSLQMVPGHTETAVIVGMRRTEAPAGLMFLLVLPGIALGLFVFACVRGMTRVRLLVHGEAAKGKLVDRRPTNVRINKQPVIEYVFAFRTLQGSEARASVRSHAPGALLDSTEEPLFYDPLRPERAVLLGALPGDPRLDEQGRFTAPTSALALLVGPAIAVMMWMTFFLGNTR